MQKNLKRGVMRFLLWSQKYIKTDMMYLASGGFWLVLGQIVSSLSALALAAAFANLVSPESYGTYKYILSLAGIFAIFSLPGMNTAVMQTAARGQGATIHDATRARIQYASLGSILALMSSSYYLYKGNIELSFALLIIAATLPFFDTFTSYLSHLAGLRRFDLRAKYHASTHILSTLIVIATIFITENLLFILLSYFVPFMALRVLFYCRVARTIPRTSTKEQGAEVVRYGKHLTAMQILGMIGNEIDKILIWKFLGPVHVAVYTFALAIPEQIKGPLKGMGELAFPKFATQTPEQIKANLPALWRKLGLYALGILSISFLYILAAPYIFKIIFPQYMASVPYSQLYAVSMVTNIAWVPIALLAAQRRTKIQYILSTIQPIIAISLLAILVPYYGIMGALFALILSKFITLAIYLGALFTFYFPVTTR